LLDATRLRNRWVDTVAVVWDTFEKSARALAKLQGVPDLPIFVIPAMVSGEDDYDQRRKAEDCLSDLVACWATPPGSVSGRRR
jgi:hypothetical protein